MDRFLGLKRLIATIVAALIVLSVAAGWFLQIDIPTQYWTFAGGCAGFLFGTFVPKDRSS